MPAFQGWRTGDTQDGAQGPRYNVERRAAVQQGYTPGGGTISGSKMNNNGFLVLFALLAASMVVAGIWFFFWAKNGGCVFRKGDWEDYKSTVLRRKGPDGRTLSNATKSTRLGGGTVMSSFGAAASRTQFAEPYSDNAGGAAGGRHAHGKYTGDGAGKPHKKRPHRREDRDVREYRHERAARVGGINRQPDGSHLDMTATDMTATDRSEAMTEASGTPLMKPTPVVRSPRPQETKKSFLERQRDKKRQKKDAKEVERGNTKQAVPLATHAHHRVPPSTTYTFTPAADEAATTYTYTETSAHTGDAPATEPALSASQPSTYDSYYQTYRPHADARPQRSSRHRPEQPGGPTRQYQSRRYAPAPSEDGTDTGTKAYRHHIPGLTNSDVGVDDSVSQVAARAARNGYRRDGRGRRDSLSESE